MYAGSAAGLLLPTYIVYKAENLWSTWMEGGHMARGTAAVAGVGLMQSHLPIGLNFILFQM